MMLVVAPPPVSFFPQTGEDQDKTMMRRAGGSMPELVFLVHLPTAMTFLYRFYNHVVRWAWVSTAQKSAREALLKLPVILVVVSQEIRQCNCVSPINKRRVRLHQCLHAVSLYTVLSDMGESIG